ncbi:hypothetical protein [Oceanisphaera psychrotolerans]|uniref:hypothetical protein n=1 Tax=Oceanisphaera psychrotolerans TaxID=1414654 RepID=UPI001587AF61|nr:hypothetical protein [Oceanisphaera psychrotolerans]
MSNDFLPKNLVKQPFDEGFSSFFGRRKVARILPSLAGEDKKNGCALMRLPGQDGDNRVFEGVHNDAIIIGWSQVITGR